MDLTHVVVSMMGTQVAKVQCKTCGSLHKYRPPKYLSLQSSMSRRVVVKGRGGQMASVARTKPKEDSLLQHAPKRPVSPPKTKSRNSTATTGAAASKALARWNDEVRPHDNPDVRRYTPKEAFALEELLRHPKFGVGKVTAVRDAHKVVVLFRDGERMLVINLDG